MNKKLATWILGSVGGLFILYLTWVGTVLIDIREDRVAQRFTDKDQSEAITNLKESQEACSDETSEKISTLYKYVDHKDEIAIRYLIKIYSGLQKVNQKLRLPVDYNGINGETSYNQSDTLIVNN